jgi:hypothetical protein
MGLTSAVPGNICVLKLTPGNAISTGSAIVCFTFWLSSWALPGTGRALEGIPSFTFWPSSWNLTSTGRWKYGDLSGRASAVPGKLCVLKLAPGNVIKLGIALVGWYRGLRTKCGLIRARTLSLRTDGRTDGPTDGRTDGPTDIKPGYSPRQLVSGMFTPHSTSG